MVLSFEPYTKQCLQAEWHVVVPRAGKTTQNSPPLTVGNWFLKFFSDYDTSEADENWRINLIHRVGVKPEFFLLTVHIRSKDGSNICMSYKEINERITEVWSVYRDEFFGKYPEIDFSQNRLTFIFTIDREMRSYQDRLNADKSVQTCRDDRQCLENLSLDLRKLTDEGSDPDVQLRCGDCSIPAHKLILGTRSDVFRTMLQSDMLERKEGVVEIVDMEPKVFQIFIHYLYTGLLPELTEDNALPLYEAGDKYHVDALKDRCRDFLAKNLTFVTACEVLVAADAHSDEDLKNRAISYIVEERIPEDDDVWSKFCHSHPELAFEVLNLAFKQCNCYCDSGKKN